MGDIRNGIILKGIGGFYYVLSQDRVFECKASGRLRKREYSPVAGDMVQLELTEDKGFILEILPRKNYFVRPPIANIDKLFIAATEAPPKTDTYLIDKMCVIAMYQNVEPIIVITKNDVEESSNLKRIYESCGIKVVTTSAETKLGCDDIRSLAKNSVSVFSGNSGVGKSSILNAVFNEINIETGEISERILRGKNTTRTTELYVLKDNILIADTPGFSSFDLSQMHKTEKDFLMHLFPEIEPYWDKCRFNGCTHRKEPDCAVKQEVSMGRICQSRYDSYVRLYEELSQMKEW